MFGGFIVAPAVPAFVDPLTTSRAGGSATLQLLARDRSATTDTATTTTAVDASHRRQPTVQEAAAALPATARPVDPASSAPATAAPVPVPAPVPVVEPAPPATPVQPIRIKGGRGRTQTGKASWYEIDDGTCAHVRLPKGTLVRVVNTANGKEAICRVADRGPFLEGRIIDLDLQTFKQIADRSEGVVDVRISW